MVNSQEMEINLGLPVIVEGFNDGVPRRCYPFKLSNLTMANLYLSSFDQENIYENFGDDGRTQAMKLFFQEAFKPKDQSELVNLLNAIDGDNFAEIVGDIKKISGIVDIDKTLKKTYQVNGEKISWGRMVNIIPLYTSTPHSQIKDMTLVQLNETIDLIQRKINWDYKVNTLSLVKEPDKYINKQDGLFYEEPKKGEQKVTTMKEIMDMM